jgi:aarF domain-containing kinase
MPSSMKDLTRLFNGLTLIANEFAKRSLPARTSDFETLIKTALLSATNVSGITKGQLRQFSPPQPSNDASSDSSSSTPSVVVFSDQPSSSAPDSAPPPPPSPATTKIEVVTNNDVFAEVSNEANRPGETSDATVRVVAGNESEVVSSSETVKQVGTTSEEVPVRKRRPRERKVPSTPFSRALGLVLFCFI